MINTVDSYGFIFSKLRPIWSWECSAMRGTLSRTSRLRTSREVLKLRIKILEAAVGHSPRTQNNICGTNGNQLADILSRRQVVNRELGKRE
jgi:hypothetical protein